MKLVSGSPTAQSGEDIERPADQPTRTSPQGDAPERPETRSVTFAVQTEIWHFFIAALTNPACGQFC